MAEARSALTTSREETPKQLEFGQPKSDVEGLVIECHDVFDGENLAVDPVFHAKANVLNAAIQEIGMGKYQWLLFIVAGFGWAVDNLQLTALIINPVTAEFPGFPGPFLILAQSIGLTFGAVFWGVGCDIWGRKISFNLTLLIAGMFVIAAGGAPTPIALCSLIATWNLGVGGNLPVDSAVFLEFVPASHQWLLTVLSIWWAIGQLVSSLIAWAFIAAFSCAPSSPCPRAANMGWRYYLWTIGALVLALFVVRALVFRLHESPKFLVGRGRDARAVAVAHALARCNGRTSGLTVGMLESAGAGAMGEGSTREQAGEEGGTGVRAALARRVSVLNADHVRALFKTRRLAYSTTLLVVLWAFIGLAFPLYNGFITVFLQTRGADFGDGSLSVTYRNYVILSCVGIPGALLAGWMVELRWFGRRGTLALSSAITGAVLLASTTARTAGALLGWNCAYALASNVMYGVLYAVSPELFPAKDRGTGNALVSAANRVFGVMAPVVALYADLSTPVPIYVSGVLYVASGFIACLLPFEPRGRASI